jgi:hypothetical protein
MKFFRIQLKCFLFLVLLGCVFGFLGCADPKPDGLPNLQPVSLQFTQDGTPCEKASVNLSPQDGNRWAVGGSTDANGIVQLKTHGKYQGVPAGKYKIVVTKTERETVGPPPNSVFEQQQENIYDLIDPVYSNPEKTPLEIEIVAGKNQFQPFDLGKKIRELTKTPE